ncbi:peptidoglycan -binding protein [Neomegalonema sp.]|uniref:peptidoglycan -binding protein n=1 Tax=Neomegalonema sp. TaxID=2039713 RepID=UPI0026121E49|nr:peptidoglycan -binding protein [Neomegalonema sp.]MDD2866971.1 peptidoglycan -binding protein [Neomegalonema sp.]
MALGRRRRDDGGGLTRDIWPAFVDVMTSLLLVLMFVLSIFMLMQHFSSQTIADQSRNLEAQRAALAAQEESLVDARGEVDRQTLALSDLSAQLDALARSLALEQDQSGRLQESQAQLASSLFGAQNERDQLASRLNLTEQQRADLERDAAALSLELEAQRRRAEETLTLLAAAEAARTALETDSARERAEAMTETERNAALLALAESRLADQEALNLEDRRQVELLNQQLMALRAQMASVAVALDAVEADGETPEARIADLGARLNVALADKVDELTRYRSEFFGRVRAAVEGRPGVQIVGDRFVFQSEVLFPVGSPELGAAGREEIARVAGILKEVSDALPPEVPWVLRVDGHTDSRPIAAGARYADNWELSQARALSVARFLIAEEGFPADRVAATGFGEFQPLDPANTPEAWARNRRIELKLTER